MISFENCALFSLTMVFSGIVESKGNVKAVQRHGSNDDVSGLSLVIQPIMEGFLGPDIILGSSIAVNGTCLTVTKVGENSFSVDLAPETLEKTSFNDVSHGSEVNLERALKVGDRNSGHTVQGHVDGVGVITSMVPEGVSMRVKISTSTLSLDPKERQYMNSLIVPKGFIAVDGASLTVCEVNREEEWFTFMLIPHTLEVLKKWEVNGKVNLELDCLAKYMSATVQTMVEPVMNELSARMQKIERMNLVLAGAVAIGFFGVLYRLSRR